MARPKGSTSRRQQQQQPSSKQNTLSFAAQPARITKPSATAAAAGVSPAAAKAAEAKAEKLRLEAEDARTVVDVLRLVEKEDEPVTVRVTKDVAIREQQREQQHDHSEVDAEPVVQSVETPRRSEDEEAALKISEAQVKKYWRAKEEARIAPRVHQQKLTVHDKILREFDLSSQFGPCIGIQRTRRWKRARALGLNPPIEVLKVLMLEEEKEEGEKEGGDARMGPKVQRAYMEELLSSKNMD